MQAVETCRPLKSTWPQILLLCPGLSKQWNPELGEAGVEPVSYCPGAGEYPIGDTLGYHTELLLGCPPSLWSRVLSPSSCTSYNCLPQMEKEGAGRVMTVQVEAGGEERCWALLRQSAVREQASNSSLLSSMVSCVQRTFSSLTLLCV